MLLLPTYLEEQDEAFINPDSEWYLGDDIVCHIPKISDYTGKLLIQEKEKILNYLIKGQVLSYFYEDELNDDGSLIRNNTYSDGTYIWHDTHINYVAEYSLDLPKVFKDHVLSFPGKLTNEQKRNIEEYVPPPKYEEVTLENLREKWFEIKRLGY